MAIGRNRFRIGQELAMFKDNTTSPDFLGEHLHMSVCTSCEERSLM
jgi:hypothetical protein